MLMMTAIGFFRSCTIIADISLRKRCSSISSTLRRASSRTSSGGTVVPASQ